MFGKRVIFRIIFSTRRMEIEKLEHRERRGRNVVDHSESSFRGVSCCNEQSSGVHEDNVTVNTVNHKADVISYVFCFFAVCDHLCQTVYSSNWKCAFCAIMCHKNANIAKCRCHFNTIDTMNAFNTNVHCILYKSNGCRFDRTFWSSQTSDTVFSS